MKKDDKGERYKDETFFLKFQMAFKTCQIIKQMALFLVLARSCHRT